MSMLKVAGVDENGQPKGIKTNSNGKPEIVHEWAADEISVFSGNQIRDTNAVWSSRVDVSKYATISLRVQNTHDQPVDVIFGMDTGANNTTYLKNYGGSNLGFTIPASSDARLITPEEFPFLQYIKNIRIRCSCSTAPTAGSLSVTIVGKY